MLADTAGNYYFLARGSGVPVRLWVCPHEPCICICGCLVAVARPRVSLVRGKRSRAAACCGWWRLRRGAGAGESDVTLSRGQTGACNGTLRAGTSLSDDGFNWSYLRRLRARRESCVANILRGRAARPIRRALEYAHVIAGILGSG